MSEQGARLALNLYKRLLRYGQQIQLTDRDYFANRIRSEFYQNKNLKLENEIEFSLKKGEALLSKRRVL